MDKVYRKSVLSFVRSNALGEPGKYRYSASCTEPTLYSSCYAAMLYSLFGEELPEKEAWAAYLCSHQDEDGLFRDPVIYDQGWYEGDPLWCGRSHLTSHVLIALTALGAVAPKPLGFVKKWEDPDFLVKWLESSAWEGDISYTGNEIMNVGGLLQYERDFHGNDRAGKAVSVIFDWLNTHHLNPETGLWGDQDLSDPCQLSNAVQAAYHWWELYFYDNVPVPCADKAVESILRTQNVNGGFGLGVHNPDNPFVSSACEDIDSLAPMARLYRLGTVRNDRMKTAMETGLRWVKSNQMPDGGLVFMKDRGFEYGHRQLHGAFGQGAMFPTWFRTLTVALVSHALGDDTWHFVRCPQMQFDVGGKPSCVR